MNKKLHRKTNSVHKRLFIKCLKIVLFIGVPLILFGLTFHLKNVTIVGTVRYTPEQIKEQLIRSEWDKNALLLYLKHQYFIDFKLPFIEKIDVELKDNNTIKIQVYEKRVTGCVEFMGEYLYFDKDGIVVESSQERLEDIPLIKGLKFDKIILHEKLEVQTDELFDVILNLTQQIEKYELDIKTIRFNTDYEVTVESGEVSALLGKRNTYDEVLSELKNILAGAKGELTGILNKSKASELEIDMKNFKKGTDIIIAKPKKPTD